MGFPDNVEIWAMSPICPNQAMLRPKRFITVQGHPEFNGPIERFMLEARHAKGVIDTPTFKDAILRVDDEHDGEFISGIFVNFLLEE